MATKASSPEARCSGTISPLLIGASVTKLGDSTLVMVWPSSASEAGWLAVISPVLFTTAKIRSSVSASGGRSDWR